MLTIKSIGGIQLNVPAFATFLTTYITQTQEEHSVPHSSNLLRNAITRSSLVAVFYSLNIQNTETSNMFLNKHYEIPFVKECVARFPLPYSDNDRHRLYNVTSDDLHNVTSDDLLY